MALMSDREEEGVMNEAISLHFLTLLNTMNLLSLLAITFKGTLFVWRPFVEVPC